MGDEEGEGGCACIERRGGGEVVGREGPGVAGGRGTVMLTALLASWRPPRARRRPLVGFRTLADAVLALPTQD